MCTYLGGCGEPVMFMSAPNIVYGQTCDDVGSGEVRMKCRTVELWGQSGGEIQVQWLVGCLGVCTQLVPKQGTRLGQNLVR